MGAAGATDREGGGIRKSDDGHRNHALSCACIVKNRTRSPSNMRTGTRLVLSALLSIAMSFSPDVRSMVRHPSCASSRNHIHMQLDHHGDRAFDDVSLASVNDLWIYDDDDMVLAAVEAKLEMAKRVPLADLRNDKQNDRHLHFTGEDEGCYLLSECAEGNKMFFSCSSFPWRTTI